MAMAALPSPAPRSFEPRPEFSPWTSIALLLVVPTQGPDLTGSTSVSSGQRDNPGDQEGI